MKTLRVVDVGHGLHFKIDEESNSELTVDYGGSRNLDRYRIHNGSFLLSHLHYDHYNGFLKRRYSRNTFSYIEHFYHPGMPRFFNSEKFLKIILAWNVYLNNVKPYIYQIIKLIKSNLNLNVRPLFKGDSFECGETKYEILWPPKELDNVEINTSIKNAIEAFELLAERDENLKRIYRNIQDEKVNSDNYLECLVRITNYKNTSAEPFSNTKLVESANTTIRKAANSLSLVFRQEDNILFLGDLEETELPFIMEELKKNRNLIYDIIISAHHGTHWHPSLFDLRSNICVSSLSRSNRKHFKYEYNDICNALLSTDQIGDIYIEKKFNINI